MSTIERLTPGTRVTIDYPGELVHGLGGTIEDSAFVDADEYAVRLDETPLELQEAAASPMAQILAGFGDDGFEINADVVYIEHDNLVAV